MRLADVQLSFPFILLALTINAIVGLGLRNIILSLSAAGWVVYARVVRGEVLSVKQRDYVHAAAALGVGRPRLLFRHVLLNVAPSIIVVASLQFSQFVVAEAAISFLGFGVQPPTPAWGSMLSESRDFLYVAWWLGAFPGAALPRSVTLRRPSCVALGDWSSRPVSSPRSRRRPRPTRRTGARRKRSWSGSAPSRARCSPSPSWTGRRTTCSSTSTIASSTATPRRSSPGRCSPPSGRSSTTRRGSSSSGATSSSTTASRSRRPP